MLRKILAVLAAAIISAALAALPADAAKKGKRSRSQTTTTNASPSLDGRTLGRMRTRGYDYLQYDGLGAPRGPYCH
jgi:hypothetical protein